MIAFQDGFHFIHEDQSEIIGDFYAADSNTGTVDGKQGADCDLQTASFCCFNVNDSLFTVNLHNG